MIIRAATPEDAASVVDIWNAIIRDTSRTFTTQEKTVDGIEADILSRKDAFIVAEIEKVVVGFATYFPFRSGPGYAYTMEHSVNIREHVWGRGVGRALMARLEEVASVNNVHSLIAGVSGENSDGVNFHKAIGYAQVARLPAVGRKFDRWMDLILLQKFL